MIVGKKRLCIHGVLIAVALVVLTGCSTYPEAPTHLRSDFRNQYVIGPGDSLDVVVWGNPDLSSAVVVAPDGTITTPLVEDVPVSGKTNAQVAREIEKNLKKYVKSPVVTVLLTGFVGTYDRQIRVIGEATKPQTLQYRKGMTVMDVMIAVGGLTDYASGNSAVLVRHVDGKMKQYNVRLDDLLRDGDISANVAIAPGDVLIIPESFF